MYELIIVSFLSGILGGMLYQKIQKRLDLKRWRELVDVNDVGVDLSKIE